MREIFQCFQHHGFATNLGHARIQAGFTGRLEIHKLVDMQLWNDGAAQTVKGLAATLPTLHRLGVFDPKIVGESQCAGVEQVAVFQRFVVLVILCQ